MGSLLLFIGQCGNQVGLQLLDYLDQSEQLYDESYLKRQDQNIFHSILIDTEPKILKPVIENRKRYPFIDIKNVSFYQHGRGNNWALGYMDKIMKKKKQLKLRDKPLKFDKFTQNIFQLIDVPTQSSQNYAVQANTNNDQTETFSMDNYLEENSQIIEQIINQIRKEIEKIDYFLGFNTLFSLGGGTGSGLGSRLIEEFRDLLSDVQIISTVVFPNKNGETTLQHYNTILTLAQLQTYSDAIIYFQNDKINNFLNYAKSKSIDKAVDLSNINQYIASNMMNLMRINDYQSYDRFYFDIISDSVPLSDFKFLEFYSTPYYYDKNQSSGPETTWEKMCDIVCGQANVEESYLTEQPSVKDSDELTSQSLAKDISKQLEKKKNSSISVQAFFRHSEVIKSLQQQQSIVKSIEKKLKQHFKPVSWNPDCLNMEYIEERLKEGVDNKMMLAIANKSYISGIIKDITDIAYSKFSANAFLHWYYKSGLEKSDFENAFLVMDNIVENYSSIK